MKKINWFIIGMVAAVFLAWLFPDPGAQGGSMHPEILNKAGVALIFFLHGLLLSFSNLKEGVMRWRLHLIVQLSTFLMFPLFGFIVYYACKSFLPADLCLGFFFLCALPSTVSSSVAMTAAAKGNVPVAVFNATISSIIGIFITPLWLTFVFNSHGHGLPIAGVIIDLVKWLLVPLIVGQLLRPLLGAFALKHKKYVNRVDRATILLLIYTSFCDSMKWGVWTGHGISMLLSSFAIVAILFFLTISVMIATCKYMGLGNADKAAVVFCGTKKGLAMGVPMGRLIFAGNPGLSLILLPIMLYHPLQLLICGPLANRWAKRQPA